MKTKKEAIRKWSKDPVIKRIAKPSNIRRARSLGYRAKQGFVLARSRIRGGKRKRSTERKGRKPKKSGLFFTTRQSLQAVVEKRVARKFPNLEVLNSYYAGESGTHKFYEVILVDPHHSAIRKDRKISWISKQRRRAFRGLTSAGKR